MAYVIKHEPGGWFKSDLWEIGYYTPDGEWVFHSYESSREAAEDVVNKLGGGNFAVSREHAQAELELERERLAAAAQVAANLAERERINRETVAANERLLAEQARAKQLERAKWLEAETENRRRAQAEAAEQLRLYPPSLTVCVGGVAEWDGQITFHTTRGEQVVVPVADID